MLVSVLKSRINVKRNQLEKAFTYSQRSVSFEQKKGQ
jgi:hypothetical protein